MKIKITLLILSLLQGGWMLFDGFHVLLKGKYFGPEKPGPWSQIVRAIGVDPFRLGPVFVLLGALWLVFLAALLLNRPWSWSLGLVVSVATLWYLPVGTVLSLITLALLLLFPNAWKG